MKIKWSKNLMGQDEASLKSEFVTLWHSLDWDDFTTDYVGVVLGKVITKKYKTKAACKKAIERWLKENVK